VLSYLFNFDNSVDINAIFYVDLAMVLLNCIGYNIGTFLLRTLKWNPKSIILLGGIMAMSGFLLSSFS
jgi:hypothetical protein